MTVDNQVWKSKNTDRDAGDAAYMNEVTANSDVNDAAMSQGDDHSAIATHTCFSPEIPESDSGATLDEEEQFHPSVQGGSIGKPSGKRSRSLSGPGRADDHDSGWIFDVFAEDDGGAEGDSSPASKRARPSPHPSEAAKNGPSPTAAVMKKGVQVPSSAHDDRPPPGDQEYEVRQVVGESGLEYEVTAVTKMWLPKASVDRKLVRKYRVAQRAATRVRTRWSSRLQNKK